MLFHEFLSYLVSALRTWQQDFRVLSTDFRGFNHSWAFFSNIRVGLGEVFFYPVISYWNVGFRTWPQ
jgi:hypothetical protein